MSKRDYYEILGIARNASPGEVKSAYRELAIKFHPDKNQGNKESEEKFKDINEAYSVLSDPNKKKAYDQYGHAGVSGMGGGGAPGGGFGGFDFGGLGDVFGDIFEEAFGGRRGRRRAGGQPGRDLRVDREVSLRDVLSGTETAIDVSALQACLSCSGSGSKAGSGMRTCGDCKGTGQVRMSHGFFTMAQTCGRCRGEGEIVSNPCVACRGSGRTQRNHKVKVKIPPGVENGTTLRISGAGEAGERGASPGDLYVVIQVRPDKKFERDGADLYSEAVISFPLAALGGEISVPTLEGPVKLKIPAGTQPGVHFRIGDRGLPRLKARSRGDLYVRVQVAVPKKMSREERKLLQQLAENWGEHRVEKDESVFRRVFGG